MKIQSKFLQIECCYAPFDELIEGLARKRPGICTLRSSHHNGSRQRHKAVRMFMIEGYKSDHQGIVHCFVIVDLNFDRRCI